VRIAKPKRRGYALSIDKKGRVTIPAEARRQLGLHEGDVIYLRVASNSKTGVFKKAVDPFEVSIKA
jgi:AbrB family looped-hinge helix DNA binding protein